MLPKSNICVCIHLFQEAFLDCPSPISRLLHNPSKMISLMRSSSCLLLWPGGPKTVKGAQGILWAEFYLPTKKNSHVEVLTLSATIFGDLAFMELTTVKPGYKVGPSSEGWCP